MTYFDKPNMAYVENDELYMREIRLTDLDNNPDCERDFNKPGYWVKINSPTMARLVSANCNLLSTHLQARRRYDDYSTGNTEVNQAPMPQKNTRTRRRV